MATTGGTTTTAGTTQDENWARCALGMKMHGYAAVIEVLFHLGLPNNPQTLFIWMTNFKKAEEKNLKKYISKEQWDILCHDCSKCPNAACARKGIN